MKTKEVYVITAFSRPQFYNNIIENFKRQTFQNKHLIIVENGSAIGVAKDGTILNSVSHVGSAKNTALRYPL